jgi:hypothetical protein
MNCDTSYSIELAECPDTIQVTAGLSANTSYTWLIEDKNGNEYYEVSTTNASGRLSIDCSVFPDGYLNRGAGFFTITIYSRFPYYQHPLDLTFCGVTYQSIVVNFVKGSTTQDTTTAHIDCLP